MEFKILPLALQIDTLSGLSHGSVSATASPGQGNAGESLPNLFLYLLLVQGFFTGFAIGKLAEGSLKAGIKHSFIMIVSALLISTGVRAFI